MSAITEITMPQLAESQVTATIERWLKKPGEWVDVYEPICEIITDKVVAEIPSTVEGTVKEILVGTGEDIPVGASICIIETAGEENSESVAPASSSQVVSNSSSVNEPATQADTSMRHRYSPAVQQLAAQHGVQLENVTGTGMGGRITRKDVLAYVASGAASTANGSSATNQAVQVTGQNNATQLRTSGIHLSESPRIPKIEVDDPYNQGRGETYIDVTPIRSTIARNMRQSVSEIPHAWMMIEVDVTNLVLLRNKYKDEFKKREGVNLTYLAFLLKAVVNAIRDFPIINSVWATDKIIVKRDINISLAVGTEDSVLTPVIKNADHKNVAGLAKEIEDLARKTREGKLSFADMQGGTFTVNNTGSFGSILSYPIINYPQAAILTFESIVKKPVVINDMIAVRSMANLCMSLDHRILDGVISGRFLQRVKDNLESYNLESTIY